MYCISHKHSITIYYLMKEALVLCVVEHATVTVTSIHFHVPYKKLNNLLFNERVLVSYVW